MAKISHIILIAVVLCIIAASASDAILFKKFAGLALAKKLAFKKLALKKLPLLKMKKLAVIKKKGLIGHGGGLGGKLPMLKSGCC